MVSTEAMAACRDAVASEDFYRDRNQWAYVACCMLYDARQPVNQVSVASKMSDLGVLEDAGGLSYLMELVHDLPTPAGAEWYAKRVREQAQYRRLIQTATHMTQLAFDATMPVNDIVSRIEAQMAQVVTDMTDTGLRPMSDLLTEHYPTIRDRLLHPQRINGISTGFARTDSALDGLKPELLYVIGGAPGGFKTAFASHIARHVALDNQTVALFSMEMASDPMLTRLLYSHAGIDFQAIRRRGRASQMELDALEEAQILLDGAPLHISDDRDVDPVKARRWLRRLARTGPISLLVFDYLHLMKLPNIDRRQEQLKLLMDAIAELAQEFHCPALILSQLGREATKTNSAAQWSFYESAAIEQRGDTLMVLRPVPLNDGTDKMNPNRIDAYVSKNKSGGPAGFAIPYWVTPETVTIEEYTGQDQRRKA